ncbi:MAG: T9SS type A sorting domain-containing protein, partial [Ignavibacterium sp.]
NNNEMWTSIKNFNGSFDPSGNLDNIRGAVTVANATSGEGFIVWSVDNVIVGVDNEGIMLSDFSLFQNYPNPFNPSTTILYEIPEIQHITIRVFDLLGKEVATLVDEEKHAGKYSVDFDGRNLSTGMYIYKIQAGSFTQTKKMILLK